MSEILGLRAVQLSCEIKQCCLWKKLEIKQINFQNSNFGGFLWILKGRCQTKQNQSTIVAALHWFVGKFEWMFLTTQCESQVFTCWLLVAAQGLVVIGLWFIVCCCLDITPSENKQFHTKHTFIISLSGVSTVFIYLFCLFISSGAGLLPRSYCIRTELSSHLRCLLSLLHLHLQLIYFFVTQSAQCEITSAMFLWWCVCAVTFKFVAVLYWVGHADFYQLNDFLIEAFGNDEHHAASKLMYVLQCDQEVHV